MAFAVPSRDDPRSGLGQQPGYSAQRHCDAALAALADVQAAIARDDIEGRCNAVNLATEAVTALILEADVRGGGRMVENAAHLYRVLLAGLIRINLRNDAAAAREVSALIEPLRGAGTPPEGVRAVARHIHHVR